MSRQRTGFKKGEIVVLTSGAYSDYMVHGVFEALVDFVLAEVCEDFIREKTEVNEWDLEDHFFPWLVEKEYVKDLDDLELHMGAYTSFNPRIC